MRVCNSAAAMDSALHYTPGKYATRVSCVTVRVMAGLSCAGLLQQRRAP